MYSAKSRSKNIPDGDVNPTFFDTLYLSPLEFQRTLRLKRVSKIATCIQATFVSRADEFQSIYGLVLLSRRACVKASVILSLNLRWSRAVLERSSDVNSRK